MEVSRTTTPITEFDLTPFPTMGIPIVTPSSLPSKEDISSFIASVKGFIAAQDLSIMNTRLPPTSLSPLKKMINHYIAHRFRDDVSTTTALATARSDLSSKADALAWQIIGTPPQEGEFLPLFKARSDQYITTYRELSKLIPPTHPEVKHYATEVLHPTFLTHMIHTLPSNESLTSELPFLADVLKEYIYNFSYPTTHAPLIPSWSEERLIQEITFQISPAFREAHHKGSKWIQQLHFLNTLPATDLTFPSHLDLLYRIQNLFTTSVAALPEELLPQTTSLINQIFESTDLRETYATLTTTIETLTASQAVIMARASTPLEGDLGQLTQLTYQLALTRHKKNTLSTLAGL